MIWKTRINQLTKTKYPIIMGAFAGIGRAKFAAPFSEAGGLGIITALNFEDDDDFKAEIKLMKKLTNKPFGVNFTIAPPFLLEKNPKARSEETYLSLLDIALKEGVKIFTTSAYQANLLPNIIKEHDAYWFHKCTTLKHAMSAEKAGADGVTLVGLEGTGFKNPLQYTTLINITVAKKKLNVPIIAAGGIGDARGFLGALIMGAEAVCFGTAIMATKECPISEKHKSKIVNQNIYDEKYYKQIFHLELKDKSVWSPASAVIVELKSIKDFVDEIIEESEKVLFGIGIVKNEFNTIS